MATLRTRVTASETGESQFAVRIEMGDHEIIGDEPSSAGGGGLGPNPFDLISAALAECTVMTVRWFASQREWPLDHVEVVVDHSKIQHAGATRAVDVFEKTLFIRGPELNNEQYTRLIDIADKCPIQRLLQAAPIITTKAGTPLDERFDR